jgi:ligand-binding SRPBCC domain-containing protein
MPIIRLTTRISAPIEVCFDLARSVEAHVASAARTDERAVAGVTRGLLSLGDEVTWEAVHFGIRQRLSVRITELDRPHRFIDEMTRGAFARFCHEHLFSETSGTTEMVDVVDFSSPLGFLGKIAEVLAIKRHLVRFLTRRNEALRSSAESRCPGSKVLP